jgi:CheY-like chemotaxis protein
VSYKILVVEDDFDTRYVLSLVLKGEGYSVITAGDGECALNIVFEQQPDLIITDIRMPRLDGIELTKRIRSNTATASILILAISGYGDTPLRSALRAGANGCCRKPFTQAEVVAAVRKLLS